MAIPLGGEEIQTKLRLRRPKAAENPDSERGIDAFPEALPALNGKMPVLIDSGFRRVTAHASALLPVMPGVTVTIHGVSPLVWALLLCYTVGLATIVTPYAGAVCPI